MTKTKSVNHFRADKYDEDFPTENLLGFAAWIARLVEEIPADFRETATIEFGTEGSDFSYPSVRVDYARPENDEERTAREAAEEARRQRRDDAERVTFEALKRKYGS